MVSTFTRMRNQTYSIIVGSGSYLPTRKIPNQHFKDHQFFEPDGKHIAKSNEEIIQKFQAITGINERRYVTDDLVASDIAFFAAQQAIESSGIDKETLDYIIVAHNFGDIREDNRRSDMVPTLASRVKQHLGIQNSKTVVYDLPFGCAGWLQGVIQANYFIRSGDAKRVMVIGTDTLSRICDPHDRDSMIYSDGAGAVILESRTSDKPVGILSHYTETIANGQTYIIHLGKSSNPDYSQDHLFLKMKGRKLYEQALKLVPHVIQKSIEKAELSINDIDKFLIHQANNKMDEAILEQLQVLNGTHRKTEDILPMTISFLGNSSVATIPTLYDLMNRGELGHHRIKKDGLLAFAAVGAGININSMIYKVPDDH
jgi:3-oxoacyl-[acyl-carrier-protein] synthase-3